jgi:hypothetical protein
MTVDSDQGSVHSVSVIVQISDCPVAGGDVTAFVALLCAVNVGGTGKLAMADLRRLLAGLGYGRVETYIQSGNAVFDAKGTGAGVAKAIATALEAHMGAPVGVVVRTHEELERVIAANPFATEAATDGARVHAVILAGIRRRTRRLDWNRSRRSIRRGRTAFIWMGRRSICICRMARRIRSSRRRR